MSALPCGRRRGRAPQCWGPSANTALLLLTAGCLQAAAAGPGTGTSRGGGGRRLPTCSGPQSVQALVDHVTAPPYDSSTRPGLDEGRPTRVEVQLHLTKIVTIDEKKQFIEVSGYFRRYWDDPRLAFQATADGGCHDELIVPHHQEGKFWQPDNYFDNSIDEWTGAGLLQVSPSGSVWHSSRVKHKFECSMNFARLPYDEHKCTMVTASYSQNANNLEVIGKLDEDNHTNGLSIPSSYCGTTVFEIVSAKSWNEVRQFSSGPWNYVILELRIKRKDKFHMKNTVVNAIFFVVACYISFFIPPGVAPARVAITCIPVLTLRNLLNGVNSSLPAIPYETWLTSYLFACMVFCVAAVFEYGLVAYLMQVEKLRDRRFALLKDLKLQDRKAPPTPEAWTDGGEQDGGKANPRGVQVQAEGETEDTAMHELADAYSVFCGGKKEATGVRAIKGGLQRFGKRYTEDEVREMLAKFKMGPQDTMDMLQFHQFMQSIGGLAPTPRFKESRLAEFVRDQPSAQVDNLMRCLFIGSFAILSFIWYFAVGAFDGVDDVKSECGR